MIRRIVPRMIFLVFFFLIFSHTNSSIDEWQPAIDGEKIILIRHSLAPGSGDPKGFNIEDCKTQRNLNYAGIEQSKKIGAMFKKKKIKISQVLSSQWCRCRDTAKYAFKNYKIFSALNSTFQSPFNKNEQKQIKELKDYIKNWDGNGGNLVLVTHYVIISAITNYAPSSGEIIITDKNFNILSTISSN